MAKQKQKQKEKEKEKEKAKDHEPPESGAQAKSMSSKEYSKALYPLHVELVKLQEWVVQTGAKVCIIFEAAMAPAKVGPSRR